MADSARWERFEQRPGDVIITTPSKCGTTWMQTIVGILLNQRTDLPPIGTISPWLDMQIRTEDEVFGLLAAQTGRRFMKTHTPLDGLPANPSVTYLAVIRHPLDVALSDRDHMSNMLRDRTEEMREAAVGKYEPEIEREEAPEDPAEFLRWFIDNHEQPMGSGPYGLEDYCQQVGDLLGRPRPSPTSISFTTPTCGTTSIRRCAGWRPRWESRSTSRAGRASWKRRLSSRCGHGRRRQPLMRTWACGSHRRASFESAAREIGHRC